jgi:hypothetical protein
MLPVLVDKRTGDVYRDWPIRAEGPTAQGAYQELLREIRPRLRELGFQGSGGKWRLSTSDRYLCLVFTRYARGSSRVCVRFYLSAKVWTKAEWDQMRSRDPSLPKVPPPAHHNGRRFESGMFRGIPTSFYVLGAEGEGMADSVLGTIEWLVLPWAGVTSIGDATN